MPTASMQVKETSGFHFEREAGATSGNIHTGTLNTQGTAYDWSVMPTGGEPSQPTNQGTVAFAGGVTETTTALGQTQSRTMVLDQFQAARALGEVYLASSYSNTADQPPGETRAEREARALQQTPPPTTITYNETSSAAQRGWTGASAQIRLVRTPGSDVTVPVSVTFLKITDVSYNPIDTDPNSPYKASQTVEATTLTIAPNASNSIQTVVGMASHAGRSGSTSVRLTPVQFITPAGDPVNAPVDAGTTPASTPDGANEFTFSAATTGVLTIHLKAKVLGIGSMPAAEQAKFTFEVDSIGSSAQTIGSTTASGDFITATATYTGLPADNAHFGQKKARVKYDGNNAAEADFEVFFPRDATNHPGTGAGTDPNWFYYWKHGDVCGIPATAEYDATRAGLFGYVLPGVDSILRLGPMAPTINDGPHTLSGSSTYGSVIVTGHGKGIECVAETVAHELHHLTLYNRSWKGWFWTDDDSDGVDDSDEPLLDGIKSDPLNPDTFNSASIYPPYSSYGDDEVRCRKIELTPGINIYPNRDWASPGCQSFNQFGPTP